jgi:glutathione S-transferase
MRDAEDGAMTWIILVSLLALLQYLWFGILVARARTRYAVTAPAVSGHPIFERYYRVQMNTLELLVLLLPALAYASLYVPPRWPALLGVVYLIGRQLYCRAYVAEPAKRELGFTLSMVPIVALLLIGIVGSILRLLRS